MLTPGTTGVRDLHLPGKGYPGRGRHAAGDLLVSLTPVFPARLTAEQRKLLLELDQALTALRTEHGESGSTVALTGTYHNLLRMWADA